MENTSVSEVVKFPPKDFNCVECKAFAEQHLIYNLTGTMNNYQGTPVRIIATKCHSCKFVAYWFEDKMIFPPINNRPPAHEDMPESVKELYNEAANVFTFSPRASAALCRVALEKLCNELGATKTKTINEKIGELVAQGLPIRIKQAMDTIRSLGNEASHIGTIDYDEEPHIAEALFDFLNTIVEDRISAVRQQNELYERLSPGVHRGIAQRDGDN